MARSVMGEYLPADAIIEDETVGYLPGVLNINAAGVAGDGGGANVVAARRIGWRHCDGVDERSAGEQSGERIRERFASLNVVHSALRRNVHRRIGGASAEVVFAVGADSEIGRVAIQPDFAAGLDGVLPGDDGEVLLALEEIAIGGHDRSASGVESLVEPVVELDGGVGVVRGGKLRGGSGKADRALKGEARRDGAGVGDNAVALMVHISDAEGWINGGLVGVGGWSEEVVEVEAGHQLRFTGELVIEPDRELVRVGYDFGRGGVSVDSIGAGGVVG